MQELCELDPDDIDNNGLQNEDLIIWMRTAALPNFRKLYRKVYLGSLSFDGRQRDEKPESGVLGVDDNIKYRFNIEYSKWIPYHSLHLLTSPYIPMVDGITYAQLFERCEEKMIDTTS